MLSGIFTDKLHKNNNLIYKKEKLVIFFGNAATAFDPQIYKNCSVPIFTNFFIERSQCEPFSIDHLITMQQVHEAQGFYLKSMYQIENHLNFNLPGDFLITKLPGVAIGIITADCLPVILFDSEHYAVGIAHAGLKGSLQKIAVQMLHRMTIEFKTKAKNLQVFFGPSAKPCCYQVGKEIKSVIQTMGYEERTITIKENHFYFDLPFFNRLQLQNEGVLAEFFNTNYNVCTIENDTFCSYRRENKSPLRQLTFVAIK